MSEHKSVVRAEARRTRPSTPRDASAAPGPSSGRLGEQAAQLAASPRAVALGALGRSLNAGPAATVNRIGLPDRLKAGVETLSGVALDDVRVHFNSSRPAQFKALAYAQGRDIHLGPGQERHLPHEAWHVAQQAQGRVRGQVQAKGELINADPALEREADVMGARAMAVGAVQRGSTPLTGRAADRAGGPIQRLLTDADVKGLKADDLAPALAKQEAAILTALMGFLPQAPATAVQREAHANGLALIKAHILPSLSQGWTASVIGYVRELAVMADLNASGRPAVGEASATLASHADVTWQSPTAGVFAAQMKTIERKDTAERHKAGFIEHLLKADQQLGGGTGERPAAGATLVVDIAIDDVLSQAVAVQLRAQVGAWIKEAAPRTAHSVRVRTPFVTPEGVLLEFFDSYSRSGERIFDGGVHPATVATLPGEWRTPRNPARDLKPASGAAAAAAASSGGGEEVDTLKTLIRDYQTLFAARAKAAPEKEDKHSNPADKEKRAEAMHDAVEAKKAASRAAKAQRDAAALAARAAAKMQSKNTNTPQPKK